MKKSKEVSKSFFFYGIMIMDFNKNKDNTMNGSSTRRTASWNLIQQQQISAGSPLLFLHLDIWYHCSHPITFTNSQGKLEKSYKDLLKKMLNAW